MLVPKTNTLTALTGVDRTENGDYRTVGARTGHGAAAPGIVGAPFWRGGSNSMSEDGASASFSFSFLYAMKPDAPLPFARRSV